MVAPSDTSLSRRLAESLYTEAMLLADEARSYFDRIGRTERDMLPALARVGFSCESLRVTTRLMHVIAWLLNQRAVVAGEITAAQAAMPERRLGPCQASDPEIVATLPDCARALIRASEELYARVLWFDRRLEGAVAAGNPVSGLIARLENAF